MAGVADREVTLADGSLVSVGEAGDPRGFPVLYLHDAPGSRHELEVALGAAAATRGIRLIAPDRPGIGRSSFRRYSIRDYPKLVAMVVDELGIRRFRLIGVSSGGKYACACAWRLGRRIDRVALVATTCSFDLTGAPRTWSKQEQRTYGRARRARWLLRLLLARRGRKLRARPEVAPTLFRDLSPPDLDVLERPDVRTTIEHALAGAFEQGARGVVHDLALEARPWQVPLSAVSAPVDLWHGHDDRTVSAEQSRILAGALPSDASMHLLPGEGHLSIVVNRAGEVLDALLGD